KNLRKRGFSLPKKSVKSRKTPRKQVARDRLSHAYLFTGTRGTGKTTCAKIMARAVNCQNPQGGNPCNACPACLGIESGAILDVLELDAASNNGVDQIRALRDEAIYTPAAVRKRVYIVDEVHMLSTAAFNALLKILEEPPAHLMFILATTELHKVPATIKSRCQQFAFKRISPKAIADHLGQVAREENIPLTQPAAGLLARLADGGLRDALSLLDQCSGTDGELTEETVLDVLGLAGSRQTARILDCVAREDTVGALEELDALYRDGKDMGAFLGELSSLIRDLLIRKTAPEGGQGLLTGGYEDKVIRQLIQQFTAAELVQMMTLIQTAQADLYRSTSRRLDAELCLIRLCDRRLSETTEGLLARLSRLEEQVAKGVVVAQQPTVQSAAPKRPMKEEPPVEEAFDAPPPWDDIPPPPPDERDLPPWDMDPVPPPPRPVSQPIPQPPVVPAAPPPVPPAPQPPAQPAGFSWPGFLASLQNTPPGIQSFLRKPNAVTGVFGENDLTLWVEDEMVRGLFTKPAAMDYFQKNAAAYTGQERRIHVKVGKPEAAPTPSAAAPVPPGTPAQHDNFNDLLALGRQFGNFTVK
ncbi:MAG: DNA polymerase III subunit gamma/tau, partial [Ruminiclostridium sp.]|nr:DNA polymerase III subunit gamma/tau [Ruminiclostridium sp.]